MDLSHKCQPPAMKPLELKGVHDADMGVGMSPGTELRTTKIMAFDVKTFLYILKPNDITDPGRYWSDYMFREFLLPSMENMKTIQLVFESSQQNGPKSIQGTPIDKQIKTTKEELNRDQQTTLSKIHTEWDLKLALYSRLRKLRGVKFELVFYTPSQYTAPSPPLCDELERVWKQVRSLGSVLSVTNIS